jgi:NAD(P)-dependent dehydrogenase (short-subunit alcohol dehydrogenase family)
MIVVKNILMNIQDGKTYDPWVSYGQSKTANNLMALELAHRLKSKNIQSYSIHPGVIMGTNLGTHLTEDLIASLHAQDKAQGFPHWQLRFKNSQAGSATHLVAAFDPTISDYNVSYLEDCNVVRPLKPYAADKSNAERLWSMSEEMVGEKFEY